MEIGKCHCAIHASTFVYIFLESIPRNVNYRFQEKQSSLNNIIVYYYYHCNCITILIEI